MDKKVKELIKHQVNNNLTDQQLCNEVSIARMTLYNLKKENHKPSPSTIEVIDKFLNNELSS